MTRLKTKLSALLPFIGLLCAQAQRDMKTINDGWFFRKASTENWQPVNVPHTYNLDAYSQRNYYMGKAFYQKSFVLPEVPQGKRCFLKIDAASKAADLTLNGQKIGSHAGGYSAFTFDITPYIQKNNTIEITVDNSRKDITPISADFTFWGGIYRDVWLITTSEQHFNLLNHGSDGIFISTPHVDEKEATIEIRSEITNDATEKATLEVIHQIYDPQGKLQQTLKQRLSVKAGETQTVRKTSAIGQPQLWSPESPRLYEIVTTLRNPKTGMELDRSTHKTGFRWFSFDGEKGFSLNGKPYKLRGVNRHQDQAPVGVALDDEAHRRDIRLIKEMGCNFIRIAHYPQDDALVEACDEMGLLAWEEIPIINIVPDTPGYDDNCETNLTEMIRQHYNHPSIIAWGYMNEILLTAPGPDRPEWPACRERTVKLAQRLEKTLKQEDPYRASVMAFNMTNLYNEIGLDLVDVSGWNLYHGWYVGQLNDFNRWMEDQHARYPKRPTIISEWGAGSDRRLHSWHPKAFDFSIEYQQTYVEHYLPFIEGTEYISGCTYWNFIDFNVAARQESMPRVNNKGLFYNDRTPKDVSYYFKAMWRKDTPVLHIASRDWPVRTGDKNEKHPVKIYTNLDEVELIINGKSIGKQRPANCHTVFNVTLPYETSTLKAQGDKNGQMVEDVMVLRLDAMPDLAKGDELAINVGSDCTFTSDVSGLTWLPDQPYSKGSWGYIEGKARSTTSEIENTTDGPLYQTWRENLRAYQIDAPSGTYEVELLMADVSRSRPQLANLLGRGDDGQAIADSRFNITICGRRVETDFSPADGGHYRQAFRRRYIIQNKENKIDVLFETLKGKCHLAGIKIRKL